MNLSRLSAILGPAVLLAAAAAAHAQQQQQLAPHIGYVYPAGVRQGTTVQVTVGGQYLLNTANAYVTGAGVQAEVVEYNRPMSQKEFTDLRETMQELQKKPKDAATMKEMADIRAKMLKNPPNRQATLAIAETVTLKITTAADAEPGRREIRLAAPAGLTNPLAFCVGQLPEVSGPAAKAPNPDAERFRANFSRQPITASASPKPDTLIVLPAVVNGQVLPGAVDRFRFPARKGQRLVVTASARELIPYLPDAVPGWFQATLALYDAKGKEVAYADRNLFRADPALYYEVPEDGNYVVEIKDSIYRGREDFVYRITVGEMPFITGIFPLGGRAGTQTAVELKGWNLPATQLTMNSRDKGPGIYPISMRKDALDSNPMPFAVDTLPECLKNEQADKSGGAQQVTLPIIVNGRIDRPDEWDVFRFDGRAGDEIVAEVYARRLDSPLDSVLKLTDAAGKQLAFNDDYEDKGSGLDTHHADSYLRITLPADGAYCVHLGDSQHKGGPEYAYRLRISHPRPDFQLRVAPSSMSLRGGSTLPVTVYALRRDGFSGEIALALKDAPPGFTLSGARVPANQDQVRLTLTVPPTPSKDPITLSWEGRAMLEGREMVRPAMPAENMMQAFAYHHLVPVKDMEVVVMGRFMSKTAIKVLGETPVKIPAGGTARLQIGAPTNMPTGKLLLELSDPPDGITVKNTSPSGWATEMVLQCDAAKVKPGLKGNLIINVFVVQEVSPEKAKAKGPAGQRRNSAGTLPAIPFEIVPPLPGAETRAGT